MSSTFTQAVLSAAAAGVNSSGSVVVPANTKMMFFFVCADASNTAANNIDPATVSWNSINATKLFKIANNASGTGQCLTVYGIANPAAATSTAIVNHSGQFHHQAIVCVANTQPLTITFSADTFYGTTSTPSVSIASAVGDQTIFMVLSDSLTGPSQITIDGSSTLLSSDGGTRQTFKISTSTSTGTTQSESWTLASAQRTSAVAINIHEGVVQVDSINGSASNPAIDVSATNTATTTGLGDITSITVSDGTRSINPTPNMPSGDGNFAFTWPYTDGITAPIFGTPVTATFSDGANSAAMAGTYPLPSNYNTVTWLGATNISPYHLGSVLTLTDGNFMHYENAYVSINQDGSMSFILGTTFPYVINGLLQDATSGVITRVIITVASDGAVISVGGLTVAGLTTSGLTTAGITRAGL